MAENSKIEWTHHTANLWIGCVEVHEGCDNCYARVLNHRWGNENWGNKVPRRAVKKVWADIARFQKAAAEAGEIHRVFVGSMMDIFEKPMPVVNSKGEKVYLDDMDGVGITTEDLRQHFFKKIVPECPNLMFLLLTKRPGNINKYIPKSWMENPPANVMFGTSPVNQKTADKLIPQLKEVNGYLFLSIEPQLGQITLYPHLISSKIDWVICGGESGAKKRPFDAGWARHIMRDCERHGVPFFMKQIDKIQPIPEDLMIRQFPK